MTAPIEESDRSGHPPSLIRVFAVHSLGIFSCLHAEAKTLIRLGGCPGWSESSLDAHAILLVLSWGGSYLFHHLNFHLVNLSPQQLRELGFRHIDALDPSEAMLSVAKKENLYDNYIIEFLTDKQLPIAAGRVLRFISKLNFRSNVRLFWHFFIKWQQLCVEFLVTCIWFLPISWSLKRKLAGIPSNPCDFTSVVVPERWRGY